MKPDTIQQYDEHRDNLAEKALLTLWPNLAPWHDSLVLVGGLVPRYLCKQPSESSVYRQPGTIDTDFGIALAASAGGMTSLNNALAMQGFSPLSQGNEKGRFNWGRGDVVLPVDFLAENPNYTGAVPVDDIMANTMPGINRALEICRWVEIKGPDLNGTEQRITVRVCEVGPFLTLKLRAFYSRRAAKDAYDILHTVLHYDQGPEEAGKAFGLEVKAGNPASADAVACLKTHFKDEKAIAPTRAANFLFGPDTRLRGENYTRIQQQMVEVAILLKSACSCPV